MQPEWWDEIPSGGLDVRLVVSDMDGTLLTTVGAVPDSFWPLLETMRTRGITFAPASGRQYATLAGLFPGPGISYIAENGNLVVHGGQVLSTTSMDAATVRGVIDTTRTAASVADLGLVVCGRESAYVERTDAPFLAEVRTYYAALTIVEDLTTVSDTVLKLALYDFADAERTAGRFADVAETHQVVVSSRHWIDIMDRDVDKGRGVRALQRALGVGPAQTVVFGDYLNDLELLDAADWSFAVANAHPEVRARARYVVPSNDESGVVTVLRQLLAERRVGISTGQRPDGS